MQIVAPAERFGIARGQHALHAPGSSVTLHDAMPVVGDEYTSLRADLQTIRPALIFDHERPRAIRRNPEDSPEGNVDDIKIALGVEGRAFNEAVGGMTRPVRVGPFGRKTLAAEILRHRREQACLDQTGWRFQIHHSLGYLYLCLTFAG